MWRVSAYVCDQVAGDECECDCDGRWRWRWRRATHEEEENNIGPRFYPPVIYGPGPVSRSIFFHFSLSPSVRPRPIFVAHDLSPRREARTTEKSARDSIPVARKIAMRFLFLFFFSVFLAPAYYYYYHVRDSLFNTPPSPHATAAAPFICYIYFVFTPPQTRTTQIIHLYIIRTPFI